MLDIAKLQIQQGHLVILVFLNENEEIYFFNNYLFFNFVFVFMYCLSTTEFFPFPVFLSGICPDSLCCIGITFLVLIEKTGRLSFPSAHYKIECNMFLFQLPLAMTLAIIVFHTTANNLDTRWTQKSSPLCAAWAAAQIPFVAKE